ncbi:MAG: hypothetical protein K2X74_21540 [Acetobacteraceae bacterium]|nr:hypothetical protein [Acetobacteraceae bacterium]
MPGASVARFQEPRFAGLRDVAATGVNIATFPNPDPSAACILDREPLETRMVDMVRAAGLQTLSIAERLRRNRENGEAIRRALDAQRRGERLSAMNPEEARQRDASIAFMRTLPGLLVLFTTTAVGQGPEAICVLSTFAMFRVYPETEATIGGTGHRIFSGILLWDMPLRTYVAPEAELAALARARLEATIEDFLDVWRQANRR